MQNTGSLKALNNIVKLLDLRLKMCLICKFFQIGEIFVHTKLAQCFILSPTSLHVVQEQRRNWVYSANIIARKVQGTQ